MRTEPGSPTKGNPVIVQPDAEELLQKIIQLLRTETTHDFALYKKNTIIRRIERRMSVHRLQALEEYLQLLHSSRHEISILFKELLIGVTSFFRDAEAFELLRNQYLPELLREKSTQDAQVRVWVPGCSTGEESYSIAIILSECLEQLGRHLDVQIFASDLDERAIGAARAGIYPAAIAADVGPVRLEKFFTKKGDYYQVKKKLREMVNFCPAERYQGSAIHQARSALLP